MADLSGALDVPIDGGDIVGQHRKIFNQAQGIDIALSTAIFRAGPVAKDGHFVSADTLHATATRTRALIL